MSIIKEKIYFSYSFKIKEKRFLYQLRFLNKNQSNFLKYKSNIM